jgi:hypothetical protein
LFDQVPESHHIQLFKHGSAEDPRLLGDAQFIGDMWRQTGRRSPDRGRHARHLEGDISGAVTQVIERFNALCNERLPHHAAAWRRIATYDNVRSRSRKRPLPMIRALSAAYLIEHQIATAAQAARFFGGGARSVSARRRRSYQELFREWFGAMPQILLDGGRDGDWSTGPTSDDAGKVLECEGRSEFCYSP